MIPSSPILPPIIPPRSGVSPIGTTSPNSGATAATNSTYGVGVFTSGTSEQSGASYTLQNTDYQGIIIFDSGATVNVTLNSNVTPNFQATILNLGSGAIALATSDGSAINNGPSSLTLAPGQGVQVFYANRAWLAYVGTTLIQIVPQSIGPVTHEWVNSYDAATGLFSENQPAFTDISGTAATSQIGTGTPSAGKYVDGGTGAWTALPSSGASVISINGQTTNYAAVVGDLGTIIQMNSGSATAVTLPVTFATGFWLWVKNVGAGTCTVAAASGDIDADASIAITQWQAFQFYWDGSTWHQLSQSLSP